MKTETPLEELSEAYKYKGLKSLTEEWEQKILDDRENEILYIVPAGFSQSQDRKHAHKDMYQTAVTLGTEKKPNPFGVRSHSVILRPEPTNRFDKFAIQVGVRFDEPNKMPGSFRLQMWKDLGFIPKAISELLTKNLRMLGHGTIYSVHAMFDQNLYYSRIVIPYGTKARTLRSNKTNRFRAIMEE